MPEGDTVHRAARALDRALTGAVVHAAGAHPRTRVAARRLAGRTVAGVEARGKHLLVHLADAEGGELALHTHLGMTGSWHLWRPAEREPRPRETATVWLETHDRVAGCFRAPVCELLDAVALSRHPVLAALGPDLTAEDPDLAEADRRLAAQGERALADALLDQRVLAGVGNVYKSELCFLHRVHPLTPVAALSGDVRRAMVADAARLLHRNATASGAGRTTTDGGATGRLLVYGRGGRPCRRCGTPIASALLGDPPRRTTWCPRCQPERAASAPGRPGASVQPWS